MVEDEHKRVEGNLQMTREKYEESRENGIVENETERWA